MLKLKKRSNEEYDLPQNIESGEVLESLMNKINTMSVKGWVRPSRWVERMTFGCSFDNPSLSKDCSINFNFKWDNSGTKISDYHVSLYDYINHGLLILLTPDKIFTRYTPEWNNSLSIDQNIDRILKHVDYVLNVLPSLDRDELRDLSY